MDIVILLGAPGSGKGTIASRLASGDASLKHVSSGDLLRGAVAKGTPAGMEAKAFMDKGSLVPDALIAQMIKDVVAETTGDITMLLDGFPRNLAQAADLDKILEKRGESVTAVAGLMISDEMIRERIKGRAVIEGRADDASDETVNNRIKTYHAQTEPLIDYYKAAGKYWEVCVDGGEIAENRARVLALMDKIA